MSGTLTLTRGITGVAAASGSVTSIAAGAGITLTPDPIVTTGTVALTAPVAANLGGTGVANAAGSTITLGGAVTYSGAFTFGATLTGNTSVTFPTSGTLVNTGVTTLSSLTSIGTLGSLTVSGLSSIAAVAETYTAVSISSNTLTINLSQGTVFNLAANNANITTFTISNAPAGKSAAFSLVITANGSGFTQDWGASVVWPAATAPTLTTTNGKRDILTFFTNDGGTTWFGIVTGQNY